MISRRRDRKRFWEAVQFAAGNEVGSMYVNKVHPIWGLRAIRDFEKINGVVFNPRDRLHRITVGGMGRMKIHLKYMRSFVGMVGKEMPADGL